MITKVFSLPFGPLSIESADDCFFDIPVLGNLTYNKILSSKRYDISLGSAITSGVENYRQKMFLKGLYLGHHLGPTGSMCADHESIKIKLESDDANDYRKVLWNYALKVYLSISALEAGAIHLKATTLIDSQGMATLLIGRGGSGKSVLAKELANHGFIFVGNTHALVKDGRVWAINSWTRSRSGSTELYLPPCDQTLQGDAEIKRIVLIEHNQCGKFTLNTLAISEVLAFSIHYVLATGAYDLKEDLSDIFGQSARFMQLASLELLQLEALLGSIGVYSLSSDIFNENSRNSAISFFKE